jgi:uncharacterized protein
VKLWAFSFIALALLASCDKPPKETSAMNPVSYFEIPVTDIDRAMAFYTTVFGVDFVRETVDGYDMALFPYAENGTGASGALAKGDVYVPSKNGPILYFKVDDIDGVLQRATQSGGGVLYAKKEVAPGLFVGEIQDSEGNRIALQMHTN